MAYTVLNESLQVKGKLTLNNGKGSTAFFADTITQQIATDNSNDPTNATAMAFNEYDKQGNAKQWGHSITVSVEATDLGSGISTNDYLMYFDDVNNHYYLMKVITAETDRNSGFVTISGVNTAIYELGKQIVNDETTFKQANLQTVVNGLYKNAPFSVIIQDDLATVIDYTVSANTSLQAVLQDLQTKYNVDVDSWIELDESGNIADRIIYFGHIGKDNGELIRYGGAKGFENINAQELSDTIYTKLYVTGLTNDTDPTKGHIGSVNNGMEYILDDNANAKQYAIGASQQQPVYLEGSISNALLSEPQALLTWAKAQMGIFNHPRFNYTVTPLHDQIVGIGDTIAVQDFHIKPEILVTSKVIQKSTSFASPETNTFVLGEFSSIFTENANKGAGVIQLIKKDVTVVQEAADNARVSAEAAHEQALQAQEQAVHAQTTADGKKTTFTFNSVDDLPATANQGDQAWVTLEDGTHGYTFINGHWIEDINPSLKKSIQDGVTTAISTAKADTEKAIADNNTSINNTVNEVAQEKIDLAIKDGDFNNKAQAMADKALADAKANTATVAQDTLNSANQNIADAKKSLSDDIAKEVSDRASAVSTLDTKAQGYADQAKQDAINAATTADGVINKKINDTASSISSTISQNKQDAEGKISTAQSTATQALNGLSTKVSQTDYNTKTGQLQTDLTTTTQTANQATTDIVSIKQTDTSQDSRMNTIVSDANGTKQTVSDLQTTQGKQSGYISTLQQRADGFDATVTKVNNLQVGGTNLLQSTSSTLQSKTINTGTGWGDTNRYQDVPISVGQNYTFRVWLQCSTKNVLAHVKWLNSSKSEISEINGNQISLGDTGGYSTVTGIAPTNAVYARIETIRFPQNNGVSGDIVSYKEEKFEIGTLPTAWSPAPEDVDSATAKAQLTADNATTALSNYKTDADGRISKAQSDITQTAKDVTTKVSQSDYNKKTGDLTTAVSKAQTTADGVVSTVGNYKTSNDGRVKAAESKIEQNSKDITARVTKTDYDQKTGKLSGDISTLKQRADGFDATVTKVDNLSVGGRNLLLNSKILSWGVGNNTATTSTKVSYDSATNMWHITSPKGGSGNAGIYFSQTDNVSNIITNGQQWAFSFDIKGTGVYSQFGIEGSSPFNKPSGNVPTDWTRVSSTGTAIGTGTKSIIIYFNSVDVALDVYIKLPKLETGNVPTDYTPAPEDIESALAQVKITADGVSSIVSNPTTGLSVRVQTAEGMLNTVKSTADGAMSKASQTANDISREISDRKTGDNNTLQSAKDYTQSSITSYDKGIQTQFTQTASGILAKVGATNLFPNSEFDTDYGYRSKSGKTVLSLATKSNIDGAYNGTVSVNSTAATYQGYWTNNIQVQGGQKYSASVKVHYTNGGISNGEALLDLWFIDSTGARISSASMSTSQVSSPYWVQLVSEGFTAPTNAVYLQMSLLVNDAGAGQVATFTQPLVTATEKLQEYTPNDDVSSQLSLFKDNWSIGITDNISKITSGIVGNALQMSLISKNVTIDSPNTQITGKAWINSAMIANGAIGTAQIGDATINNAKIANLDASKISSGTIDTSRLNVGQIFAQGISTTNATIGQTLALSAGGKITAPLNGQVWDFTGNPYYYTNSTGGAPWFQVTQTGTFVIDTSGTLQFDGTITAPDVKIGNSVQTAFYTQTADGTLGGTNKLTTSMSFGLNGLRINQDDARGASYGSGGYSFQTGHGFYTGFDQANPRFAVGSDGNVLTDKITFSGGSNYQTIQGSAVNASSIHQEFFNNTYNLYMNSGSGYARIASQGGNGAKLYVNATDITTDYPLSSGNISLNTGHAIVSKDNGKMFFYGSNGNQIDLGVRSLTQSSLVSLKEHIGDIDQTYALNETLKVDVKQYNFIGDNINNRHVSPMIDDVNGKWYIPKDWVSEDGKSVDVYTITGYLIQAIKALQAQITELKQG